VKKLIRWLVIAVVIIWAIQDPAGADAAVRHIAAAFTDAARSLSRLAAGL
jgi:hypothetical protein